MAAGVEPDRPAHWHPQVMPRYELKERLGVGATATVWRARDSKRGRDVCVKKLHAHLAQDGVARSRLKAEAESAAALRHPAIVPIIDLDLAGPEPELVFPFLEGETLAARLGRVGRLEPRDAASIAAQIADGLAAAHAAGVVHRDVKPSNILLGADGDARLLDFGIARSLDGGADDLTGAGLTVGTLPYMAPEQLTGETAAPANDVFALGAVLYQMLTGTPPFEAPSPVALAEAQRTAPAAPADAPAPLASAALGAMSYEPAERPSAEGLEQRLRDWLEGRAETDAPTLAIPPITVDRRPRRRTRGVLAGALVGMLAVAVASALALVPGWLTPPSSAPPTELRQPLPAGVPPLPGLETAEPDPEPEADQDDRERAEDAKSGEKGKDKGKGNKGKGKGKGRGRSDR
jgi:eukaryotic-like serine/threonine-protein kinase